MDFQRFEKLVWEIEKIGLYAIYGTEYADLRYWNTVEIRAVFILEFGVEHIRIGQIEIPIAEKVKAYWMSMPETQG